MKVIGQIETDQAVRYEEQKLQNYKPSTIYYYFLINNFTPTINYIYI